MNERIKEVRKLLGLTQDEFGARLGVSRGAIVNLELNRATIKPLFITHMCEVFGINEDWLLTGNGKKFLSVSDEDEFNNLMLDIQDSNDKVIKGILKVYMKLSERDKEVIQQMIMDIANEIENS